MKHSILGRKNSNLTFFGKLQLFLQSQDQTFLAVHFTFNYSVRELPNNSMLYHVFWLKIILSIQVHNIVSWFILWPLT